ncbi:hypothetical protein, partial [Castellaniella sp.]|uniref:hypothetical protein n=1 Tax=Castellaniella sp. TaxID=1955812 RepID=UPI003C7607C5
SLLKTDDHRRLKSDPPSSLPCKHQKGCGRLSAAVKMCSLNANQALTVAAAEAIARGVEYVLWQKDKTYAWS